MTARDGLSPCSAPVMWVSGRVDDMINSGGENIYPDEIEDALARCPAVSAVVVVGLPDDRWGQAAPGRLYGVDVPAMSLELHEWDIHIVRRGADGASGAGGTTARDPPRGPPRQTGHLSSSMISS